LICSARSARQALDYIAGIIRRHRQQIGSPWRKLNRGRQALLVLAYLRKGETFAELAAGFGIGVNHRQRGAGLPGMPSAPAGVPSGYEARHGFRAARSGSLARGGMYQ
jgi:hypothetical protein